MRTLSASLIVFLLLFTSSAFAQSNFPPLTKDVRSFNESGVSFKSEVRKTGEQKFVYTYRLENTGNTPVYVQWDVVDPLTGYPQSMNYTFLRVGETKEFVLDSDEAPAIGNANVAILIPIPSEIIAKLKRAGTTVPQEGFLVQVLGSIAQGYVPLSWIRQQQQ